VYNMKICFLTFVCPRYDVGKMASLARNIGVDGVEIRIELGHAHNISSLTRPDERRRIQKIFEDEGIEIASVATSVELGSPEKGISEFMMESGRANALLARDLGAKILRVFLSQQPGVTVEQPLHVPGQPYDYSKVKVLGITEGMINRFAINLCELGGFAKDYGVIPAIEEGHPFNAQWLKLIMERSETVNKGVVWNRSDITQHEFEYIGNYIKHIHVHNDVIDPENDNLLQTLKKMKPIGYNGYISMEFEEYPKPDPDTGNIPRHVLGEVTTRIRQFIGEANRSP